MHNQRPHQKPTEPGRAAKEDEATLLAIEAEFGQLNVLEAADRMKHTDNPALVESLRRGRRLLAYRHQSDDRWWYPGFQFSENGGIPSVIGQLLSSTSQELVDPLDLVIWLCSPTPALKGRARPVDLLRTDPHAIITAAGRDLMQHQS
jgi:hypothetical protein